MGFLAVKGNGMAFDAFGAEYDAEGELQAFEDGALFDVEFEIRGDVLAFAFGFGEAVDLNTATAEGVFEADAVAVGADAVGGNGMSTGESGRTK